eukprot:maker-scaffold_6-snap-gene-9.28-mRNA-1 protein AED:0.00 eAED:0.00 QI:59/1/1/1/0.5/0.33/3/92/346
MKNIQRGFSNVADVFERDRKILLNVMDKHKVKVLNKLEVLEKERSRLEAEFPVLSAGAEVLLINKKSIDFADLRSDAKKVYGSAGIDLKKICFLANLTDYEEKRHSIELFIFEHDEVMSQINASFHQTKKLKSGLNTLKNRQTEVKYELEAFLSSLQQVKEYKLTELAEDNEKTIRNMFDLVIRATASKSKIGLAQQLLSIKVDNAKKRKNPQKKLGYFKLGTENGTLILIGKNRKENDTLTMKIAKSEDFFLHVDRSPGSHVIIRQQEKTITAEDFQVAADLAARYSKAGKKAAKSGIQTGGIEVMVTQRKFISKPRKAPAGSVLVSKVLKSLKGYPEHAKILRD